MARTIFKEHSPLSSILISYFSTMNFGYPSPNEKHLNPSHTPSNITQYGVRDVMSSGLQQPLRDSLEVAHPLERTEKGRVQSEFQRNMNMLRDIQGIHAPLRIAMELKAFDNVGRLPFLPSSNLSRDVILGHDDSLDFCDIFNPPEVHENLTRPHIMMERKLNLL